MTETEEWAVADAELVEAYRRHPQDPAFAETARRLAVKTALPW